MDSVTPMTEMPPKRHRDLLRVYCTIPQVLEPNTNEMDKL